jgi:hypothetical protein
MSTNTRVQGSGMDGPKQQGKRVAREATTSLLVETMIRLGYVVRA